MRRFGFLEGTSPNALNPHFFGALGDAPSRNADFVSLLEGTSPDVPIFGASLRVAPKAKQSGVTDHDAPSSSKNLLQHDRYTPLKSAFIPNSCLG